MNAEAGKSIVRVPEHLGKLPNIHSPEPLTRCQAIDSQSVIGLMSVVVMKKAI